MARNFQLAPLCLRLGPHSRQPRRVRLDVPPKMLSYQWINRFFTLIAGLLGIATAVKYRLEFPVVGQNRAIPAPRPRALPAMLPSKAASMAKRGIPSRRGTGIMGKISLAGRGRTGDRRRKHQPTFEPRHMTEDQEREIRSELARLRQEHRDLDAAIAALDVSGRGDRLTIQRLKKKKLLIKDQVQRLEDQLVPDIIA